MKSRCHFLICLIAIFAGVFSPSVDADIVLPKVFCDHMVLQRNATVPIFGTAKPNQKIAINFQQQEIPVGADANGNWSAHLATGDAGGPFEITIVAINEDAKVVINDVLIGDVWLCSGQSNMAWPVSMALNAEAEIGQSKEFTGLRLFRVEESVAASPKTEFSKIVPWQICSPESVKRFSATSYFFGREIAQRVPDVPIGLVSAAVDGTPCEAWLSRETMEGVDAFEPLLKHWDQNGEINSTHRPANLYNAMIAPLGRFPIRGVIWYQGEANVGRAVQYQQLFPAMIQNWRQLFGQPELPFCFAQLAPFRYRALGPESLPEFWESQLKILKTVPETGMAVLTDVGDLEDIHPQNKQQVGRRLALFALRKCYATELQDQDIGTDFSGPIFESARIENGRSVISFSCCESGLKIGNASETLSGFMICGEDRNFVPAAAKIVGTTVEVSSAEVADPVAVRFGWDIEVPMNLVNGDGLPASPFRTDDFPVTSSSSDF